MKVTLNIIVALASAASVANGFVISNCRDAHNFNLSDDKCQNWTDLKFSYQSNAKCTMIFFEGDCGSSRSWSSSTQNQCLDIPFKPTHMLCAKS